MAKYMFRPRKPPSRTWRAFLGNHVKEMAAIDFSRFRRRRFESCSASSCFVMTDAEWLISTSRRIPRPSGHRSRWWRRFRTTKRRGFSSGIGIPSTASTSRQGSKAWVSRKCGPCRGDGPGRWREATIERPFRGGSRVRSWPCARLSRGLLTAQSVPPRADGVFGRDSRRSGNSNSKRAVDHRSGPGVADPWQHIWKRNNCNTLLERNDSCVNNARVATSSGPPL